MEKTDDDLKEQAHANLLEKRFAKKPGRPPAQRKSDKEYWHDAMMCIMTNLQVKSVLPIETCAAVADAYVKYLNTRFK